MIKKALPFLLMALSAIVAWSCAKQDVTNYTDLEQKSLDAWIEANAPGAIPFTEGSYYEVIQEAPEGAETVTGGNWVKANFVIRNLNGDIIYARQEGTTRRLGTYSAYAEYIPAAYYLATTDNANTLMKGLYRGMTAMKKGEIRRYYIPSAQCFGANPISNQTGFGGQFALSGNVPAIIDSLQVLEIIPDPEKLEEEAVFNLATSPAPEGWGLDAADSIKNNYYFQLLRRGDGEAIAEGGEVRIYYVARFLNGRMFDTNIDTVWVNTHGSYRLDNDTSSTQAQIDPISSVMLTKKAEPDISNTMPEKVLSFMLSELEYFGDSARIVVTSRYAYYAEGRKGAFTDFDEDTEYSMPDYVYSDIEWDYYYSPSYLYDQFYTGNFISTIYPITEVHPFTPLIYDFVVVENENTD